MTKHTAQRNSISHDLSLFSDTLQFTEQFDIDSSHNSLNPDNLSLQNSYTSSIFNDFVFDQDFKTKSEYTLALNNILDNESNNLVKNRSYSSKKIKFINTAKCRDKNNNCPFCLK